MQSKAATVAQYLAALPADRRAAIEAVRRVIRASIDPRIQEGMQYGMIGYYVPHSVFPGGYHCDPRQPLPFACLASQKNYMSLYMMTVYGAGAEEKWLRQEFARAGKKLDMGKSCIRFRKLEDLPLDVIGEAFERVSLGDYIAHYESTLLTMNKRAAAKHAKKKAVKASAGRKAAGKAAPRKKAARKAPARKKATRKA